MVKALFCQHWARHAESKGCLQEVETVYWIKESIMLFVACEQAPTWSIGRREKWASGRFQTELVTLYSAWKPALFKSYAVRVLSLLIAIPSQRNTRSNRDIRMTITYKSACFDRSALLQLAALASAHSLAYLQEDILGTMNISIAVSGQRTFR